MWVTRVRMPGVAGRRGRSTGIVATAAALVALCVPAGASAQSYTAPDPGGTEANQPVPVAGKLWGLNDDVIDFSHSQGPLAYARYLDSAGANAVKTTLEWWRLEPVQDELRTRRIQVWTDVYDAMRAKGITPIFILTSAPMWARENPESQTCEACRYPPRAEMDGEWAEFVAWVATRFPESIIQVWNEPNLRSWWGYQSPDPARYAELAAVAYDAVQQVETSLSAPGAPVEIPVLGPGLANAQTTDSTHMAMREFLAAAYADTANPLADHTDGVSVNLFPHSMAFGANTLLAESFEQIRAARAEAGDTDPIYITETGLQAGYGAPFNEFQRMDAVARLYNRLLTMSDVGGVIFHRIVEPRDTVPLETPTWGPWENGLAWMHYSAPDDPDNPQTQADVLRPKLVYCRFSDKARQAGAVARVYEPCLDVAISSGPAPETSDPRPRFEFAEASWFLAGFECRIDGAPYQPCSTGFRPASALPEGPHTFAVRGIDRHGDRGDPALRSFAVEQPNTEITKLTVNSRRKLAKVAFAATAGPAPHDFECKLDGSPYKACESVHRLKRLDPGRHKVRVRAIDADGTADATPASERFKVRR